MKSSKNAWVTRNKDFPDFGDELSDAIVNRLEAIGVDGCVVSWKGGETQLRENYSGIRGFYILLTLFLTFIFFNIFGILATSGEDILPFLFASIVCTLGLFSIRDMEKRIGRTHKVNTLNIDIDFSMCIEALEAERQRRERAAQDALIASNQELALFDAKLQVALSRAPARVNWDAVEDAEEVLAAEQPEEETSLEEVVNEQVELEAHYA